MSKKHKEEKVVNRKMFLTYRISFLFVKIWPSENSQMLIGAVTPTKFGQSRYCYLDKEKDW